MLKFTELYTKNNQMYINSKKFKLELKLEEIKSTVESHLVSRHLSWPGPSAAGWPFCSCRVNEPRPHPLPGPPLTGFSLPVLDWSWREEHHWAEV